MEIGGTKLKVDYREISVAEKENKEGEPVLLLPGFGSGWEGIAELGFSLVCEGRKVFMLSLPGYGNSDNPPAEYYKTADFENEAEVVNSFLKQLDLRNKKIHLIGHSMGSQVLALLVKKHPEKIASLVLLNPAGTEKKSVIRFLLEVVLSKIQA